jgi:uroporphyrinogen decarboxylase
MKPGKETMTSRERVLKAVNFEKPDRVPIDLGGNQTGIHKNAYLKLVKHLGLNEELKIMDAVQQLAQPSESILQRFHVDTRYIRAGAGEGYDGTIRKNKRDGKLWHDLKDEFGVVWSMPDANPLYMDISHHPLANATMADLKDYPWPKGNDPARFAGLRERALELKKETPYAVVSGIAGVVYEYCWYMRGLEDWLCDLLTEPEFCEALIDQTCKFWVDYFDGFLKEVGDLVDVIMIGDDLAGQDGPLFNPDVYRSIVKPRHKKLVQFIRSRTKAKIWYHTCGNCRVYIPELKDNGVDILNPVQTNARNMDPSGLKADWSGKMVFWGGGCDSQHILPRGTAAQVYENTKRNVEILKQGGGYIFNNIHNIQGEVPPENVVAMYTAAYENGFYN